MTCQTRQCDSDKEIRVSYVMNEVLTERDLCEPCSSAFKRGASNVARTVKIDRVRLEALDDEEDEENEEGCPVCGHKENPLILGLGDYATFKTDRVAVCKDGYTKYIHEVPEEDDIEPDMIVESNTEEIRI